MRYFLPLITAIFVNLSLLFTPIYAPQAFAQSLSPQLRGMVTNSHLAVEDLKVLSNWKANSVSILLVSFANVDDAGRDEYFAELNAAMDRADLLIAEAGRRKLRVLLNLYYPPGGFNARVGNGSHRIFTDAWAQQAIIDAWAIIAERYKDNKTIWGFQLVNEPAYFTQTPGLKNWNELAQTLASNIRKIDSRHYIVVNPPFGDPAKLKLLKLIKGVSKIVYSVNMYYPFSFTHQGLYSLPKYKNYPTKTVNKTSMSKFFAQVKTFQKKAKTPIHIHELSAVRWVPGSSGEKWLTDALSIIERNKWSWNYHSFREASAWNPELTPKYDVDTPAASTTPRLKILKTYFKLNKR